jgi:hypothetical protein
MVCDLGVFMITDMRSATFGAQLLMVYDLGVFMITDMRIPKFGAQI